METGKNKNSLQEGYLLHWYEIKKVIGRGGFGITYLAHDNNLDRYIAIKEFMPEDFAFRESDSTVHPKTGEQKSLYTWGLESFVKEARTLAKFNHPNIIRVLSVFEENNTAYMVMEYAQGEDLSTVYKKSPKFTEEQFLDTFIPIMDGLALVHNAGFIHRDIKPANIYICDNNAPLLLDFGSARQSIGGKTKTLTSLVTIGYAPYEQYNDGSGKQGPWTDIYSLGACLYVGITGNKPVDALARGGSFLETGKDLYQPLSIIAKGDYSENFLLAIDNALMFKIDDRPQNILEWADMLLGKTKAPELPEYMRNTQQEDETIIQPRITTNSIPVTSPSRGTQGLVDAHGKRNSEVAGTERLDSRRGATENPDQVDVALETSSNISSRILNKLGVSVPPFEKLWLPIAISSTSLILVIIALSWYFTGSPSSETADTGQEIQQQNKHLEKLLNDAKQAFAQKKFVTPVDDNAHYFYQQVLKIEPDNEPAKKGIKKIETQLFALARTSYDDGDITAAEQYLKQLEIVSPDYEKASSLKFNIKNNLKNISQVDELLNKADDRFNEGDYIKPENDNAFYYYQQVLTLDPDNQAAKTGITNIEDQLLKLATSAYASKQYYKSQGYLTQLKSVNSESTEAEALQNKINEEQSGRAQITAWLNEATNQKKNNYYTSPENDNAYDTYNKILKMEPGNKQALDGIKNIQWHYRSQFNNHIAASQLSKAENDIRIMKDIAAPSSTIKQMQSTLNISKQNQSTAKTKQSSSKKLDINQASILIGQFKTAIEARNKRSLKNMSQYMPGREQFVDQLLSQYNRINVKVSNLRLISKENKAKAQIELTDLVDINNNNITPGSWSKFEIIIQYNSKDQLKIYW
jgi:serine/threonine protein kinase